MKSFCLGWISKL